MLHLPRLSFLVLVIVACVSATPGRGFPKLQWRQVAGVNSSTETTQSASTSLSGDAEDTPAVAFADLSSSSSIGTSASGRAGASDASLTLPSIRPIRITSRTSTQRSRTVRSSSTRSGASSGITPLPGNITTTRSSLCSGYSTYFDSIPIAITITRPRATFSPDFTTITVTEFVETVTRNGTSILSASQTPPSTTRASATRSTSTRISSTASTSTRTSSTLTRSNSTSTTRRTTTRRTTTRRTATLASTTRTSTTRATSTRTSSALTSSTGTPFDTSQPTTRTPTTRTSTTRTSRTSRTTSFNIFTPLCGEVLIQSTTECTPLPCRTVTNTITQNGTLSKTTFTVDILRTLRSLIVITARVYATQTEDFQPPTFQSPASGPDGGSGGPEPGTVPSPESLPESTPEPAPQPAPQPASGPEVTPEPESPPPSGAVPVFESSPQQPGPASPGEPDTSGSRSPSPEGSGSGGSEPGDPSSENPSTPAGSDGAAGRDAGDGRSTDPSSGPINSNPLIIGVNSEFLNLGPIIASAASRSAAANNANSPQINVPASPTLASPPSAPDDRPGDVSNTAPEAPSNENPEAAGPFVPVPIAPSSITVNDVPVVVLPENVVIDRQTIPFDSAPTAVVANGAAFTVNPSEVVAPGTVIARPAAPNIVPLVPALPTPVIVEGISLDVGPSEAIIGGATFPIGPGAPAASTVFNGQTINVGPEGVELASTTLAPAPRFPAPMPTTVAVGDLTFAVNPSQAVIGGSTFNIGAGAAPETAVVDGQAVSFGPGGVGLPSTTIAPPAGVASPRFSAVTAAGIPFDVNPSQAVVNGVIYDIGVGATPGTAVVNGQVVSFGPEGIGLPSTTIAPPAGMASPRFSAVTAGSITFDVNPSQAVLNGVIYDIGAGATPETAIVNGQAVSFGPGGVGLPSTTVIPPAGGASPTFSAVTAAGLTFAVNPTAAVISGTTYAIGAGSTPRTATVDGEVISFGPGGVGLAATTVAVPPAGAAPTFSAVTAGGLTFSVNPSAAVIGGTTYRVGAGASPITTNVGGQRVSIGPGGIGLASTTVPIPTAEATPVLSDVTAGGLTFSVGASAAVVSGTTYRIGSGAAPTSTVIGGQTVSFGPGGVGLASTTVPPTRPRATLSGVTAGGLTFSLNPSEAVISGTTYRIGAGSTPTTTVLGGGQTVSLGPGGVGLATTTIPVPTETGGGGGVVGFTGGADMLEPKAQLMGVILAVAIGGLMVML